MTASADVYVKNQLVDAIRVICYPSNGGSDSENTLVSGDEDRFPLLGTDASLAIVAPPGMDTKNCFIMVRSDLDLLVICSRTDSNWRIQIKPNDLPPDAPITVNVTIGNSGL